MHKYQDQKGFTFVELMIVILIILILSSVAVVSFNSSRAKARDAKRLADIRRIRTAMEFYYSEEDSYPSIERLVLGQVNSYKLCDKSSGAFVDTSAECAVLYIGPIPKDPLNTGKYVYNSDGIGYDIKFVTEKETELGVAGIYHAHSIGIDGRGGLK